jgi:hypothetical protein
VDINPNCKQFEEPGVRIEIGDQGDRVFLRTLAASLPPIDILIDDGGHTMRQQINTFEELFPPEYEPPAQSWLDRLKARWR